MGMTSMSSQAGVQVAPAGVRTHAATGIDADMLERMARIARDLPGHTISLDADEAFEPPPDSEPVLKIDGVVAEEILERCFDQLT